MSGLRSVATTFDHVDVLVVGAGISGIGLGCHLVMKQPGRTFAIVDRRDAIGGTWDLFRYPGIRSDADLHTFGFEFKPWTRDNAIADAHEILGYLNETIAEYDLARRRHLGHKVLRADFSREQARWTVTLERSGDGAQFDITCTMLVSAAGYYDYDGGYTPHFDADIIVTATGLNVVPFGKINLYVDGHDVDLHERVAYKSMMVSGVPNFAYLLGYTNNAWTLKVDLVADHLCRLLAHMDRHGYATVTPVSEPGIADTRPLLEMESGYLARAMHLLPRQGSDAPWVAHTKYALDRSVLRSAPVDDPVLRFTESVFKTTANPFEVAAR
jgi:cation diffusion facilitator CzcD-associated flavoprotein CzcO